MRVINFLPVFLVILVVSGGSSNGVSIINGVLDIALKSIQVLLKNGGYDPLALPDYDASFLHIGLLGHLKLTHCNLYNLSTIYRSDDVIYSLENATASVHSSLGFSRIRVNCTYDASILAILHKRGKAVVDLPGLSAKIDLSLVFKHLLIREIRLEDLKLRHDGLIDVHLEGGLIDGLASILTETISNLFKKVILHQVQEKLKDFLNGILHKAGNVYKPDSYDNLMEDSSPHRATTIKTALLSHRLSTP